MKFNPHWPARPDNEYRPWHEIVVFALVVAPIYWTGKTLSFIGLVLGEGLESAMEWWNETAP